jgi:superfamily I DNA and RNA helicase
MGAYASAIRLHVCDGNAYSNRMIITYQAQAMVTVAKAIQRINHLRLVESDIFVVAWTPDAANAISPFPTAVSRHGRNAYSYSSRPKHPVWFKINLSVTDIQWPQLPLRITVTYRVPSC